MGVVFDRPIAVEMGEAFVEANGVDGRFVLLDSIEEIQWIAARQKPSNDAIPLRHLVATETCTHSRPTVDGQRHQLSILCTTALHT